MLEIRVALGHNAVRDVDQMIAWIREQLDQIRASSKVAIAADWRRCRLMSPDAVGQAHIMPTAAHNRIERSAILTSNDSPTAVTRFVRLVREAGHSQRRIFSEASEMTAWLGEVLAPPEAHRRQQFLTGH